MKVDVAIPPELALDIETLSQLRRRRWMPVVCQTLFNLSAYFLLAYVNLHARQPFVWPVVWFFQGIILSGFLGASHDCAHNTFAPTAVGNRLLGSFWSSTVMFNFTIYKYYHLEHHKYTSVDGDTEPSGTFSSLRDYISTLPMTSFFVPFWKLSLATMRANYPRFIRGPRARRAARIDNFVLLTWWALIVVAICSWPRVVIIGYLAPMLVYFPMVFLTSLPEHYECEVGSDLRTNTRSTISNALFRYVFWNGNFHAEHHVYPSVPSYNLPRLHQLIGPSFKFRQGSYFKFHFSLMRQLARKTRPLPVQVLDPQARAGFQTYSAPEGATNPGDKEVKK